MIPLFLGLTAVNILLLLGTTGLGYAYRAGSPIGNQHLPAGALSTIVCCGVHCVVFTYFIATAKWVQHAILVKKLDPALLAPTRSFKAQAFPAALLAMGSVFATAILGAIVANYGIRPVWHLAMALASIAINLLVAVVEYSAISRNGQLINAVLKLIQRQGPSDSPATIV